MRSVLRPIDCPPSLLARVIAARMLPTDPRSRALPLQRRKCCDIPPLWYIL